MPVEAVSIGIGVGVAVGFSELLAVAPGGMIVPGYLALHLDSPLHLVGTILVSLATFWLVRFISNYLIVYGRRRFALTILLGFLLGWLWREAGGLGTGELRSLAAIGQLVPGLIANWADRQGILPTLGTLGAAALIVRLILIIVYGGALPG